MTTPNGQRPRVKLSMVWTCGVVAGHEHPTYEEAEACIRERQCQHRVDAYDLEEAARRTAAALRAASDAPRDVRYRVHEVGYLQPDGSQRCRRCGYELLPPATVCDRLHAAGDGVDRGFPTGRRVVVGPTCTFLVTPDRQLAPDEVPCV